MGQESRIPLFAGPQLPSSPSSNPPTSKFSSQTDLSPPLSSAYTEGDDEDERYSGQDDTDTDSSADEDSSPPPILPPQPTGRPVPKPSSQSQGQKPKRTVRFKPNTKPPSPKSKTRNWLVAKAAQNAKNFAGKFLFGLNSVFKVVPPETRLPSTHRDKGFLQGENQTPHVLSPQGKK